MPPLQRLGADALASELAKIPSLNTPANSTLDAVRIAIARAIASGQSADQLAADLGVPSAWRGIDLAKPPAVATASPAKAAGPAEPVTARPALPPDWAATIIPLALAKELTTRVVVLDREPTALGGLELPAWARALTPSASYGPITVSTADLQVNPEKWILIFTFTGTVEFVRAGTVLCVVPVSILEFGPPTQASVLSGSAWIAVNPFDSSAPAGSFAGVAVQSGQITSDQAFSVATGVVTVPAGASLSIGLVPSPLPPGPAGFAALVTAPASISIEFPAAGAPTISCGHSSATLYKEHIACAPASLPAVFNAALSLFYIPGNSTAPSFKPHPLAGKLFEFKGPAPIESAGWALGVSQSTTPETLGTTGPGDFALAFGPGISCRWTGLHRSEFSAGGFLIAQNNALILSLVSGSPAGVLVEQEFQLWVDRDSPNERRCRLVMGRFAGQILTYALTGTEEVLELGAALEALVDRPLLASGERVPAVFPEGIVALIRNQAGNRLYAYSAVPLPEGKVKRAYPMALDNALLEVGEPLALYLAVRTDAAFNSLSGHFYLLFAYLLAELYLPDPYTGRLAPGASGDRPTTFGVQGEDQSAFAAYLVASVGWVAPDKPTLRLSDSAHNHPTAPPTTEASSTAISPHLQNLIYSGPTEIMANPAIEQSAIEPAAASEELQNRQDVKPRPQPLPPLPAGAMLLDLSTRASQLGVEVVTGERYIRDYTIDGLSVRGPAALLPLTTLPAIAWEPMYNLSTAVDPSVNNYDLRHPPGDGPFTQVRAHSATLIPISPLQSLRAVLEAPTDRITAQLTLPFGMVGALDASPQNGTILPNLSLVRPTFTAALTPTGVPYTGAWQLSFAAPDPAQPDPVLAGRTYLRTPADNPSSGLSYGEMVLGVDVADIFSSRFDPPAGSTIGTGVPLRRYDLTGYGASTFSEWTNTVAAKTTDVIKTFFHVLVGRTSHEVIQVQSLIYPWAIKVVRTITIDRQASGVVQRYDSGWQAASDGLFHYPASTGITPEQIHAGLISGVINVKNIQQLGLPLNAHGTQDDTGFGGVTAITMSIPVQPVTFDADVIVQPDHHVIQGGVSLTDLTGKKHTCVPSKGITGFIGLQYDYHLSITDMAGFPALATGAGGPINATLNVGGANSLLRATEFDATPVKDAATSGLGIACAVRGIPKLSSDGSWSVAARTQAQTAPVALAANHAAPVVQPNSSGGTKPGSLIHYANPADIFRLDPSSTTPPETLYGFLQATGTQSNLLSRPMLTVGSQNLTLGDALNVAHAGALLGAISSFPGIAQCLQFLSSELQPITNQLAAPSLSTTQNLYLKPSVRSTPIPLISTSIADVNLYFYQKGDDLTKQADPPNVVISLGQSTSPSWSLDVNHLAIGLVIPALGSTPVIWFQGGFHADADTTPAFPSFQTAFESPLDVLASLFTVLNDIASVLSPGSSGGSGGGSGGSGGPGLNTSFSNGKLAVTDNFSLPDIPLGPGTISNVSLDIGATLDIVGLTIDFLVSIGTTDAPCQWIVDPLSGTILVQAGVLQNKMDILIQGGVGLGLAIDLGIASGSASIVIAVRLQINGSVVTILFLLTGQAQVSVLGGLASAAITLTAGLGFSIDVADLDINLIGTASVGIHISICWIINISWSGSWTFQKQLPFNPLLHS
jgi:hypothetical protein